MAVISRRVALAAGFMVAFLPSAFAGEVSYSARLESSAETPPNSSPGTGLVEAKFDSSTNILSYTATYSGLTGPATAAHFHGPAPTGQAAGVMVPVTGPLDSPIKGEAKLTQDQVQALAEGQVYFNIHTAANKGGEIRGQMIMSGR
jgi:hypothetical protein